MTERKRGHHEDGDAADLAPGEESADQDPAQGRGGYAIGLALALALTAVSFWVAQSDLIWEPAIPAALAALAIAQMGIHLVFFLHLTTGPDNTNNVLALAFGLLIVFLILAGSLWIMANLNQNMLPMDEAMSRMR